MSARGTVECERTDGAAVEVSPLGGFGEYASLVTQRIEKQAQSIRIWEMSRGVENERE